MLLLTKRQRDIISLLIEKEKYITVKEMALHFQVSSRTIRYDLDYIESWLKEKGFHLRRKPRKGIMIIGLEDEQNRQIIYKEISKFEQKVFSIEERRYFIILYLLLASKSITLQDLSDKLFVSKNTIINDIEYIENILRINKIQLDRKTRFGIQIRGDEEIIRKVFVKLLQNGLNNKYLNDEKLLNLLGEFQIKEFLKIINDMEKGMQISYCDTAKDELLINILVAFKRIILQRWVIYDEKIIEKYVSKQEYKLLVKLLKPLENKYCIQLKESEIVYLTKLFLGAKIWRTLNANFSKDELDFEVISITESLVQDIEQFLGLNLKEDIEFINSLRLHLKVAIHRLRNNLEINNPLTEQIKYRNPFIYEISRKIMNKYEKLIGCSIPDDEIAFIAMYIGAAFERNKQSGFMPNVLVVCGSGLATSNLLITRLKIMLPEIKIVGPVALNQVKQILDKVNIDFIISTIKFKLEEKDVIVVNPLLEHEDLSRLKTMIFKNTTRKQLMYLSNQSNEASKKKIKLKDFLDENAVKLNVECDNWIEAIKIASGLLIRRGDITEKYLQAMIKVVENLGPYMVIIPQIALVHAAPENGVNRECISLITLKKVVDFGNKTKEPVKIVVIFGTNKTNEHTEVLIKLIRILENQENVEKIKSATHYQDIMNLSN
ncbi:BglG family transcription antiterminator [Caloranaerobacter azorensis]|uniref:BglG family transcription antiterminator n=1 Tax=Caloranaerobacter azorensis TaxID=116090 RepID=A0A6P1YE56_9FIRM|nr:BglG family transcription antiterminator [Caloranaerobacter azorensis]QIB27610.1 BglG family transcription antiterminator [Caloranaerobacter azorensis]